MVSVVPVYIPDALAHGTFVYRKTTHAPPNIGDLHTCIYNITTTLVNSLAGSQGYFRVRGALPPFCHVCTCIQKNV